MYKYFTIKFENNAHINDLLVRPMPIFKMATSDLFLGEIIFQQRKNRSLDNDDALIEELLTPADRKIYNAPESETLGVHFYRLVDYRRVAGPDIIGAHKALWLEGKLDHARLIALVQGNCVLTDACSWTVNFPETSELITTTVDEEILVCGWMWACKLLQEAMTGPSHPVDGAEDDDESDRINDSSEALTKITKSASIFSFLAGRGMREGFSRFYRNAPIFSKAFVCKAYEALCAALFSVVQANVILRQSEGKALPVEAVALLLEASKIIGDGYERLKNDSGADDVGITLPLAYNEVRMRIQLLALFYHARLYVVNGGAERELAFKYMVNIRAFPQLRDLYDAMRTISEDCENLSHDLQTTGLFTSFMTSISKISHIAHNADNVSAMLADLAAMKPLNPVQTVDIPRIKIIKLDKMRLF